jgi:hypothetical protein
MDAEDFMTLEEIEDLMNQMADELERVQKGARKGLHTTQKPRLSTSLDSRNV